MKVTHWINEPHELDTKDVLDALRHVVEGEFFRACETPTGSIIIFFTYEGDTQPTDAELLAEMQRMIDEDE